jgi:hypothetical protein
VPRARWTGRAIRAWPPMSRVASTGSACSTGGTRCYG